jgi:predicted TIM-barrel fold metal-dependent hydrolase
MPAAKPARAVDAHAHVFPASGPAVRDAGYRPAYAARLDDWRVLWPVAGITHGVLTQVSFLGADNGELLRGIARDPARLRGVARIEPGIDDAALAGLEAGGVRAARLNLSGVADFAAYATPAWRALLDRVHARGWHIEVFTDPGRLPEIAAALGTSTIPMVFDHFGNPGRDEVSIERSFEAAAALAACRSVAVKLSAPYRLGGADPARLARRWLDVVGPAGLLWGSDWPWTRHEAGRDYARLRDMLDAWLPPSVVPAVLWDNAARIYRFD